MSLYNCPIKGKDDIFLKEKKRLITYDNLSHDEYIEELKIIFNIPIEIDIKEIARINGNYVFTRDNFIKMVIIYLRIKSNIPVILMGETGCGKTTLIKMLSLIINKGKDKLKIMNINEGVNDQDIINFIQKCENEGKDEDKIWVFFDEINTCESLGLLSEIMLKKTMNGKKIKNKFVFLASCNPYRTMTEKMKESGLVFLDEEKKEKKIFFNKDNLVYKVNPLPINLLNYVMNFGSLSEADEKKYASSIIKFYFNKMTKKEKGGKIKLYDLISIAEKKFIQEKEKIVELLIFCHNYLKNIYDNSSISLRDVRRFTSFYDWFFKYLINESLQSELYIKDSELLLKDCLNITIYFCYYLRISNPMYREDFSKKISFELDKEDFLEIPLREEKYITEQFILDNEKGIVLNRMLKENLFTLFVCLNNREPLIIIGKPGSGKTLSINCIGNSMKGEFSDSEFLQRRKGLLFYRYQGNKNTSEKSISRAFKIVRNSINIFKKNNEGINLIPIFLFDEMGLVERSEKYNNPLKVLHTELEFEFNIDKNSKIAFVGISNWKLDSAKMNRALYLLISDPDEDELIETTNNIGKMMNEELLNKFKIFFESLAKTYSEYKKMDLISEFKNILKKEEMNIYYYLNDFHGNRDFYYYIKNCMNEIIESQNEINIENQAVILTKIAFKNIERNFGGLPIEIMEKIKEIFCQNFPLFNSNNKNVDIENYNPISFIKTNLNLNGDNNNNKNKGSNIISRYLMLFNESPLNEFLVKGILKYLGNKNFYFILKGSPFIDDSEEDSNFFKKNFIKKFEKLSNGNNIIIMKDLENLYPTLFNLFDKNFIKLKDKDIYSNPDLLFEINQNLKIIILTNHKKLTKENLPFINRFEKHIISMNNLLNKENVELAENIWKQLNQIITFNNNKNLKINLKEMLIIKKYEEIAGLVYKIKNKEKTENINQEIYKILVPTFSQDLIVAFKYSGFEKKNKKLCEYIYQIYKEKSYYNFIHFFSNKINLEQNITKYIIYTFSDISILAKLINKKTEFKNLIIKEQLIDDFKSEKDLDKFLRIIYNGNKEDIILFHFSESDIYKIEYLTYKLNQYETEINNNEIRKKNKIIFIIHLKRKKLLKENNNENNLLYSYHNLLLNIDEDNSDKYEHIFIDNLLTEEDYFTNLIFDENNNIHETIKKMLDINSIFNKYIYQIYSYFSYEFLNENEKINKINYMKKSIIELINAKNKNILIEFTKQKIKDIITKESSLNIQKIIPKIYISNNYFQSDDIDFFDLIKSYIYSSLKTALFQIINILEKKNVLCPLIFIQKELDENLIDIYKQIIEQIFDSIDINKYAKPKEEYNANKIKIVLGLNIPGSLMWFKEFRNLFLVEQKIIDRYKNNEENYKNKKEYDFEYDKLINNSEEQIKKNIIINSIIMSNNNRIKKELIYDYIKLYISELSAKYINEKNKIIKYDYSLIINFIEIILYLKFGNKENKNNYNNLLEEISSYEYQKYINILSSLILFLEGYSYEILSLSEIFILISNYINNYSQKISEKIKNINNNNNIFCFITNILIEEIFSNYNDILNLSISDLYQFFEKMKYIKVIIDKINKKQKMNNLDIINSLEILLLIYESSTKLNDNNELFKQFLVNIIQNLNEEINYIKNNDYNNLEENIISLRKILEIKFNKKNKEEQYYFIINEIYKIYYNRINDENFKFLMVKFSFENNNLNINSIYFLYNIFDIKYNSDIKNIFEYFEEEKNNKYLLFLDKINSDSNSEIFNQLLLYYYELFFNQYFSNNNKNKYNYTHLSQSINYYSDYIKNNINSNLSNIKCIFSIAYIKLFIHHLTKGYLNDILLNLDEFISLINSIEDSGIKYVIQIYFFKCVYYLKKDLDNINKLNKFIETNNNFPFKNDYMEYYNEIKKENFIFENCFIPMNNLEIYMQEKNKIKEKNVIELNFDFYNKEGCDLFYCLFINHIFSPTLDINYNKIEESNSILNDFTKEFEQNILNKKLLIGNKVYYEIFKNLYTKKILTKYNISSQNQIEILLYSIRFVLSLSNNNKINENNFYSLLLTPNCSKIINSSYVPGTTPFNNVYLNSYYALKELMPITNENELGFYICSCGQYYTLGKCTCPAHQFNCQNCGLIIGGIGHYLEEREDHFRLYLNKDKFNENVFARDEVISNKIPYMFFDEYKKKYIDKYLKTEPTGINKEDISFFIERKNFNIRNMSELTFRILNFILYSFLLISNSLDYLSDDLLQNKYTHGDYTCFKCIEKDWELINDILKEKGINNIKSFFNIIFDNLSQYLQKCEKMESSEKRSNFEKKINEYINGLINDKKILDEQLDKYKKYNEKIKNSEPNFIDEIINENYPPTIEYYNKIKYPLLKFFMKSEYPDINLLFDELRLIRNYQQKYPLLNQIIINNKEFQLLSNLSIINNLSNKLLKKYSYKISRDEAQNISLYFPEKNKKKYLDPYIKSWNEIKIFCTRYLCRPDMPILNIENNLTLNYFLVDDGQLGGGMYLASAYSNFIEWQNKFISLILDNINQDSVLYCYLEQLNEEIYVQEAKEENVLNINDNIINELNNMIRIYSIRNIFDNNNNIITINYTNYKRIKFNFDEIEAKLGKLILPGIKKFKSKDDPIKFMVYLYEGNRSQRSQILLKYETKYPSRELNLNEKAILYDFINKNKISKNIINEFLSSSQILIDYIQKENYNIKKPIYEIIQELPEYIELNGEFKKFFGDNKNFRINILLNIYKYFEHFCWSEIKLNINEQYMKKIEKNKKIEIIDFFKNYEMNNKNKLITKKDLAFALRRFISRYLAGKRGDTDIDENQKLIGQIIRYDLWEINIIKNEEKFQNEIYNLTFDLNVSQALDFYEILDGDNYDIFDIKEIKNKDNNIILENKIEEEKENIIDNKIYIESIINDII